VIALLLVTALVAGGCGGPDPKTTRLIDKLDATHLTFYEVSLRDARPVSVKVREGGEVDIRYDRNNGYYGFTLVIRKAAYDPQVCKPFRDQGAECSWRDGIVRSTFEEMSTLRLDRGGESIGMGDLVTESDPTLLEDAVKALKGAKVVDAQTLASY
jgi:hypothetical protein